MMKQTSTLVGFLILSILIGVGNSLYANKPRVRREWRTLTPMMREKVANAFWTVKNLTTAEGQALYGKRFHNHDDMLMLHACAVFDPRCDNGHFGPQFMTFHRALLLKYENALLSVDSSIEAMPYWDMTKDAEGGEYYGDNENSIFSDNFFGDYYGKEEDDYAVVNGLFAYWPIAEYSEERFGSSSSMASYSECIAKEYFKPTVCNSSDPDSTTYLRNHEDCTPYVARNPKESEELGGTYSIVYTEEDFAACADPSNTPSWMSWQNCIEISTLTCTEAHLENETIACNSTMINGFYDDPVTGKRVKTNAFHSQAHIKFGKDLLDVTTSPNDVGPFTSYHANIDRSNMIWMSQFTSELPLHNWTYPATQSISYGGKAPYGTSGPYSLYDKKMCGGNDHFDEYNNSTAQPWLSGTLYDDVVNSRFAFFDLFDCEDDEQYDCSGGEFGYTHKDMLYFTAPERTPYTYDTLEHLYYDTQ